MEYSQTNSNFELLDEFPNSDQYIDRETKRIKRINNETATRNRYNPQIMRIPETNYVTHYNNVQDISPNYKTDNQPHITNYEMTYPGFLESKPIQNITAVKYEAKDTNDYNYNYNYPNTDNLYYKKHSCIENFEHLHTCKLCSSLAKTHIKLYQIIIFALILVIIFIAIKNNKKN